MHRGWGLGLRDVVDVACFAIIIIFIPQGGSGLLIPRPEAVSTRMRRIPQPIYFGPSPRPAI